MGKLVLALVALLLVGVAAVGIYQEYQRGEKAESDYDRYFCETFGEGQEDPSAC